ncbi:hypothetical protein [Pseudooctadecabacter jejudonensis]|uniref:Uncharacterized protein n=1 Tax=Pseudooctadecabacter jejudonensis TaxID=1391910 RepID=A0A1Y5S2U1_9RHOB|nr:hypothetical protein [Pseudooctadecabacter jejudonensis]SLN31431.1 hypothetical protein PSJ8397_01452 [Pseudooctadecabacter jejudonensis]
MGSFFSTLFLGLIAAVIGATIQQRTWRHRSLEDLEEKERAEAKETIKIVSEALDRRLEAQRKFTHKVLSGSAVDLDRDEFRQATTAWMGGYSSNLSRIYHSFGRSTVLNFEHRIQSGLQYASAVLSLSKKPGLEHLCTRDRELFYNSEKRLSLIQHDIHKFLNELDDRVSNGEIGRTQSINNLSGDDLEMVSRLYLVRRLLGVEGRISRAY